MSESWKGVVDRWRAERERRQRINAATQELEEFLESEDGKAAMAFLGSEDAVEFGVKRMMRGVQMVFGLYGKRGEGYWDQAGLRLRVVTDGKSLAFAERNPDRRLHEVNPRLAVLTAVVANHVIGRPMEPEEILPWICGELDRIAAAREEALSQTG